MDITTFLTNQWPALASFALGFITGVIFAHNRIKKNKKVMRASEFLAWALSLTWISLHVYGLVSGKFGIPWIFDVIGGITFGHIIGFDIDKIINAIGSIRKK